MITNAKRTDLCSPSQKQEVGVMVEDDCFGEVGFESADLRKLNTFHPRKELPARRSNSTPSEAPPEWLHSSTWKSCAPATRERTIRTGIPLEDGVKLRGSCAYSGTSGLVSG